MLIKSLVVAVLLMPATAVIASVSLDEVQLAEKHVAEYRALRRACSITRGDQRRECFSQLSDATDNYIEAKKYWLYTSPSPLRQ